MSRNRLFPVSSAILFALVGSSLSAQESASLHGLVKDPSGQVVANARVMIESPALFNPRVVLTDKGGEWRAPLLPVGTFRIVVTKEGYDSNQRANIRLGLGANVRFDLILAPVKSAIVEVVATTYVVDKTQVNAGANFSAETMAQLPLADRSFTGALDMTPGTAASGDGAGNFAIRGGATTYTNYRVNGAEVKDDYANALGSNWVIEDNIEDTQVVTSQVNVRYGRSLGGSVNVVTKSGSNQFEGSVRVKVAREDWSARTPDTPSWAQRGDKLDREYNLTFRGPIIKDRLWFALGTILRPNVQSTGNLRSLTANATAPMLTGDAGLDAQLNAGPGNGYALAQFDTRAGYTSTFDSKYIEGKLTGAITPDHIVEASFVDKKDTTSGAPGSSRNVRLADLGSSWNKYQMASFSYKGILGATTFLEARYTQTKNLNLSGLGDPAYSGEGVYILYGRLEHPESNDWTSNRVLPFGNPLGSTPENHGNVNAAVNLKLMPEMMGTHDLDLGFEYFDSYTDNGEGWGSRNLMFFVGGAFADKGGTGTNYLFPTMNFPGWNNYYQTFDAGYNYSFGAAPFVRQAMGPTGRAHCKQLSFYVNDAWNLNSNWMVGAGLRMDTNRAIDVDGHDLAKSNDPTYSVIARWDPKGDSSHLVTLTAMSSGGNFSQALFGQFTAKKTTVEIQRAWSANAQNPGGVDPSQVIRFVPYPELVDLANYGTIVNFIDQSKRNVLAPNLSTPRMDEVALGYKRSYKDQSRIGITLVYRNWYDMWAQRYDWADPYVLTIKDPSNSGLPDKLDIAHRYDNGSELKRTYKAVEIEFAKNFSPNWSLQGNCTYSRLTGNWDDGDIAWGGWRNNDPTVGTVTYNPILMQRMGLSTSDYAASGTLSNNQTQKARLALLYIMPTGKAGKVTFAVMANYDSGKNWTASNSAPVDSSKWPVDLGAKYGSSLGVAPDSVYQQYYSALGAYSYNDTYSVDMRISWDIPLKVLGKTRFIGDCTIRNLFNTTVPTWAWNYIASDSSNGTNRLYLDSPGLWGRQPSFDDGTRFFTNGRSASFSCGLRF